MNTNYIGLTLKRLSLASACVLLVVAGGSAPAAEVLVSSGVLGAGQPWRTTYHVTDSGRDGPVVLVVGGVHGNEPAGARAAEQIRHWPITRGRLVVIPSLNRLGLKANTRWFPDYRNDRNKRDLNRNFPRRDGDTQAVTPLCVAVWDFVKTQSPDWVFDLHEGFDFHSVNSKSVGSSVISFPQNRDFARRLQFAANSIAQPQKPFDLLAKSGPVQGSLARACGERLGARSFILETTFKSQPISLRTRQHRVMVSTALQAIGVMDMDGADRLVPPAAEGLTRIGVFDDDGANERKVMRALEGRRGVAVRQLGRLDMNDAALSQFDVLLFPGGSGSKQGKAIGPEGRDAVRRFVKRGGGVVGICAGAYLCTSHYPWSLHLMNAACFNKSVEIPGKGRKSMWYRGKASDVDVEANREGQGLLGLNALQSVRYENGPILSPGNASELPAYRPLAFFRDEVVLYEPQRNTMIGAPAVVVSDYGKGRVVAISPHFESTPGQEDVIERVVRYVRARNDAEVPSRP